MTADEKVEIALKLHKLIDEIGLVWVFNDDNINVTDKLLIWHPKWTSKFPEHVSLVDLRNGKETVKTIMNEIFLTIKRLSQEEMLKVS